MAARAVSVEEGFAVIPLELREISEIAVAELNFLQEINDGG